MVLKRPSRCRGPLALTTTCGELIDSFPPPQTDRPVRRARLNAEVAEILSNCRTFLDAGGRKVKRPERTSRRLSARSAAETLWMRRLMVCGPAP